MCPIYKENYLVMAKIPFSIDYKPQIESGEYKVETFSGYPVTIYRWDFDDGTQTPIMGSYVFEDGKEYVGAWNDEGHFDLMSPNDLDLFIVTQEPELTEWEKAIGLALADYQSLPRDKDGVANIHDINEFTKKKAVELLALAKEEYKNQIENDYREIIHGAYEKGKENALKDLEESGRVHCKSYDIGYDDGARDALKDLPRWKTWGNGACGSSSGLPIAIVKASVSGGYLLVPSLGIGGEQYIMLSDLEKLPGFKEDEK